MHRLNSDMSEDDMVELYVFQAHNGVKHTGLAGKMAGKGRFFRVDHGYGNASKQLVMGSSTRPSERPDHMDQIQLRDVMYSCYRLADWDSFRGTCEQCELITFCSFQEFQHAMSEQAMQSKYNVIVNNCRAFCKIVIQQLERQGWECSPAAQCLVTKRQSEDVKTAGKVLSLGLAATSVIVAAVKAPVVVVAAGVLVVGAKMGQTKD